MPRVNHESWPSKLHTTSMRRFASSFLASEKGPQQTVMSDPLWLIQCNALQKKLLQTKFVSIVNACSRFIAKTCKNYKWDIPVVRSYHDNFNQFWRLSQLLQIPSDMMWEIGNQREMIQVSRDSESLLASPLLVDLLAVRFIVRDGCWITNVLSRIHLESTFRCFGAFWNTPKESGNWKKNGIIWWVSGLGQD